MSVTQLHSLQKPARLIYPTYDSYYYRTQAEKQLALAESEPDARIRDALKLVATESFRRAYELDRIRLGR
jgi:hypothetical protein